MVSILVFLLSVALIREPASSSVSVKDRRRILKRTGILQIAWLFGDEAHLSDVDPRNEGDLRRAGMFMVQMNERANEVLSRIEESHSGA